MVLVMVVVRVYSNAHLFAISPNRYVDNIHTVTSTKIDDISSDNLHNGQRQADLQKNNLKAQTYHTNIRPTSTHTPTK